MTVLWISERTALRRGARAVPRDTGIDSMRGVAILMVIGIHSLPQPLGTPYGVILDAVLRPCVPIFLFASGFLTARSGRVALAKRFQAALFPYTLAFIAAYIYMAAHNPAMDHRVTTTAARYIMAYVFVYYYVFVYLGCTVMLWLSLRSVKARELEDQPEYLATILLLAITTGLIVGSYIDPLLDRFGASPSLIQEVRLRDIPFWFCFVALGMLAGTKGSLHWLEQSRALLIGATTALFAIYAAVRVMGIGDAADYDSVAFFGYSALLCLLFQTIKIRIPTLASLGSGSYFLYLWHIFVVMALRDHAQLKNFGPVIDTVATYFITVVVSVCALYTVRAFGSPRAARWLGA
ncbi:MAG: acyltransferase family protein [Xanthobacteraceae bacterium]